MYYLSVCGKYMTQLTKSNHTYRRQVNVFHSPTHLRPCPPSIKRRKYRLQSVNKLGFGVTFGTSHYCIRRKDIPWPNLILNPGNTSSRLRVYLLLCFFQRTCFAPSLFMRSTFCQIVNFRS